jgi:NitT/TauT family transport system substrate-binding protein
MTEFRKRLSFSRLTFVGGLFAVLASATGAFAQSGAALEPVSLRLGWTYIGGFAPLYLGLEKGFFREQGIDLKIQEGKGTVPSAATVANGSDDFGYFDIGSVSLLIDKGLALRGIAQIRQKTAAAYISMKKSGIDTPQKIQGHSVALTPGASTTQLFAGFVAANNLDMSKIKTEGLDPSIFVKALIAGQVDAILSYYDSSGLAIENQGHEVNMMLFADYGVNILDYGIATSTNMMTKKPDLVKRFVAAAVKSFTYGSENVEEAVQVGKAKFPEFDTKLAARQLNFQKTLYGDSVKQGKPIGWIETEVWQKSLNVLKQYSGLKNTDPSAYFTNEFIAVPRS